MSNVFRTIRGPREIGPLIAPRADAVQAYLPRVLPVSWRMVEERIDGRAYVHVARPQTVIFSVEQHPRADDPDETDTWLHVSTARLDRLPTWAELVEVRDVFLGPNTLAYQVLPPKSEHVNIHPNCLHLWAVVGRVLTPDFTGGSGTL